MLGVCPTPKFQARGGTADPKIVSLENPHRFSFTGLPWSKRRTLNSQVSSNFRGYSGWPTPDFRKELRQRAKVSKRFMKILIRLLKLYRFVTMFFSGKFAPIENLDQCYLRPNKNFQFWIDPRTWILHIFQRFEVGVIEKLNINFGMASAVSQRSSWVFS